MVEPASVNMGSVQALALAEAECHAILQRAEHPYIRDRLHRMLVELLQAKQQLLAGGVSTAPPQPAAHSDCGILVPRQSGAPSSGEPPALASGAPPIAGSEPSKTHPSQPASPDGTGGTRSASESASGVPIEHILSSATLAGSRPQSLAGTQPEHLTLSPDPIWQSDLGNGTAPLLDTLGAAPGMQHYSSSLPDGMQQVPQYMRDAFTAEAGRGVNPADGFQGAPTHFASQHSGGQLRDHTSSPDTWLSQQYWQPPGDQPPGGSSLGAVGSFGGNRQLGTPAGLWLDPGRGVQQQQQQQQQQRALRSTYSGGISGGGGGGAHSSGANSFNHRMVAARSARRYVGGGGGGGAGGVRFYNGDSGPRAPPAGFNHGSMGLAPLPQAPNAAALSLMRNLPPGALPAGPLGRLPTPYLPQSLAHAFAPAIHPSGELDAMGLPLFRPLTTYSWEQSNELVKIYVPLRGVQTDLLRATFTPTSVEVRVVALQDKNYIYQIKSLYLPINSDGCHVAASKTKKNVLITLQKLCSDTQEEKHWRDLSCL